MSVQARHPRPHLMTCLCGKVYSPTREDARRLRKDIADRNQNHEMCRFYECDHGGWHWTRRVPGWSE